MSSLKSKSGFSKLKVAYVMLILAILVCLTGYGYHVYSLFRDAQQNMPQPQIEKLVKDLRQFHSKTKRFPRNFTEINDLLWHTQPTSDYGAEGRQARVKNYYYFYTSVSDEQCAIWAVPLGPQRHYAPSFFFVISPGWIRQWRGKAFEDDSIASLPAIPTPDGLSKLRMIERSAKSPDRP